ncbi:MAG: hypothetical protein M1833_002853 [Piccolia ochrophora]|nr:MAG: hypothetical protein M1833_002853 [Piccolia ochrophora]
MSSIPRVKLESASPTRIGGAKRTADQAFGIEKPHRSIFSKEDVHRLVHFAVLSNLSWDDIARELNRDNPSLRAHGEKVSKKWADMKITKHPVLTNFLEEVNTLEDMKPLMAEKPVALGEQAKSRRPGVKNPPRGKPFVWELHIVEALVLIRVFTTTEWVDTKSLLAQSPWNVTAKDNAVRGRFNRFLSKPTDEDKVLKARVRRLTVQSPEVVHIIRRLGLTARDEPMEV